MKNMLIDNPEISFIIVATAITILLVLLRVIFKFCVLLWKSTLISYIVFVIFMLMVPIYEHSLLKTPLFKVLYHILGATLIVPGMLIYALIPGAINPCPSDSDEFVSYIISFIFYAIVIWGIMIFIKKSKELVATEKKQDDNMEEQTPTKINL
jgi:uncharacterized protein YacL